MHISLRPVGRGFTHHRAAAASAEPADRFQPSETAPALLNPSALSKLFASPVKWKIPLRGLYGFQVTPGPQGQLLATTDDTLRRLDPESGKTLWSRRLPADADGPPAFSPDGKTAYLPTRDSHLRALDLEGGQERWSFNMEVRGGTPKVGKDGLIYSRYDNDLYILKSNGKKKARYRINDYMHRVQAVDDQGNAYLHRQKRGITKVNSGGWRRWSYETPEVRWSRLTPTPDGNLYVSAQGSHVARLHPDTGQELWRVDTGDDSVHATRDGNVLLLGDRLRSYDPQGKPRFDVALPDNGQYYSLAAVARDGTLVLAGSEKGLIGLDSASGQLKWEARTQKPAAAHRARLAPDGSLHIHDSNSLYQFNPESGRLLGSYEFQEGLKGFHLSPDGQTAFAHLESSELAGVNVGSAARTADEIRKADEAPLLADESVEWGEGFVSIGGVDLDLA